MLQTSFDYSDHWTQTLEFNKVIIILQRNKYWYIIIKNGGNVLALLTYVLVRDL